MMLRLLQDAAAALTIMILILIAFRIRLDEESRAASLHSRRPHFFRVNDEYVYAIKIQCNRESK